MACCKFCNSYSIETYKTLYEIIICKKCHYFLKKYGVMALEVLDRFTEMEKERFRRNFKDRTLFYNSFSDGRRTYSIPISYIVNDAPYSKKLIEVKRKSFVLCIVIFIIITSFLVFAKINLLLSLIISFILARLVNKIYYRASCIKNKNIIEKEMEESNRVANQKKEEVEKQRQARIDRLVRWHSARIFPKGYRNIIEKAKKENILLYEYYSYSYPPDWEYRAEIVKKRDKYLCQKCGESDNLCVHHKRAVKLGGDHFLDNLITLCNNCHLKEHPSILEHKT